MIETWFENWQDQLLVRNLNFARLINFVSAQGSYNGKYGIWHCLLSCLATQDPIIDQNQLYQVTGDKGGKTDSGGMTFTSLHGF